MAIFNRFESGNNFKVSATRASGKPIGKTEKPASATRQGFQHRSKAPVTLPSLTLTPKLGPNT